MGGGLMQLVAYGAQDVYLTGNPQITFFKVIYRRHSNFAMESISQTINGTVGFGKKVSVTVSRNADLMTKVYLQATLPQVDTGASTAAGSGFAWIQEVGHFLIKNVNVEIGGQQIDKHYGTWLSIWNELTRTSEHESGYNSMIGNVSAMTVAAEPGASTDEYTVYVPLQFWFCRHVGLALPLIALQYHETKFNLEFETFANLTAQGVDTTYLTVADFDTAELYIDYIYLDTDERRRYAQITHEYLIEQLQFTGDESLSGTNNKIKLSFSHPVKELVWVVQDTSDDVSVYADGNSANPTAEMKLQLNGHDRFSVRKGDYFNWVQPYQHHTRIPRTGVNVYSFALKPEDQQPSGSVNMSRIDQATMQLTLTSSAAAFSSGVLRVYATNYNVLRIMSGMGGVAYSS